MRTFSIYPHREFYLREIEEAIEIFDTLKKNDFYNIPKITWWSLRYEELYKYSFNHRHVGSCIEGIGCSCSWDAPECRFSNLYSGIQDVLNLHQYEQYFREELAVLENVREDYPALMQWLKKNEKLGSEDFLLFWLEWLPEDGNAVIPYIISWPDHDIRFKTEEWRNTIKFCELFNEIYWTSDACST